MTRDQMLAELRDVLDDTRMKARWSTSVLLGYLSEGQDKFCEDTGFFVDVSSFSVTSVVGTAVYAIPDRVISVLDIWDGTRKLGRHQQYNKTLVQIPATPSVFNPDSNSDSYSWQADEETGTITLYPTPTTIKTYTLRVWRYAVNDLAGDDTNGDPAQPEIPSRFHRACIEWAAYKALMHHDMEAQDKIKAADHFGAFRRYVSDGKKALRRRHSSEMFVEPSPTYRV